MNDPSSPSKSKAADDPSTDPVADLAEHATPDESTPAVREIGGRRDGTDPTRFGDWEKGGRCIDF